MHESPADAVLSAGDDDLHRRLANFCRAHAGADAEVSEIRAMPGHSGLSFGFALRRAGAAPRHVLRLPPPGVRHEGPSDVLRQASLLRALQATAVPVPPVSWAGDDPQWFGRPYLVTEWLEGATVSAEGGDALSEGLEPEAAARQAVAALAALHQLDARRLLPGWEPGSAEDDVVRWDRFAGRGADPALLSVAPALRERLLAAPPRSPRVGLRHGDYQWSNLLFHQGRLIAILDWELASVGAVLQDLGWLSVFSDARSWSLDGATRVGSP